MNDEWLQGLDDYDTPDDDTVTSDLAAALDLPAHEEKPSASPPSLYPDEDEYPDYRQDYNPQTVPPWTAALVFDVALGLEGHETVLQRHGVTPEEWDHINAHPLFQRQVAEQAREMGETGVSFRSKARVQAEMYLVQLDQMIHSPSTDQKVKLEAIRSVVKWGGLEPQPSKEEGNSTPQVNVQINM